MDAPARQASRRAGRSVMSTLWNWKPSRPRRPASRCSFRRTSYASFRLSRPDNRVALIEQQLGHPGGDETGGAGEEDLHGDLKVRVVDAFSLYPVPQNGRTCLRPIPMQPRHATHVRLPSYQYGSDRRIRRASATATPKPFRPASRSAPYQRPASSPPFSVGSPPSGNRGVQVMTAGRTARSETTTSTMTKGVAANRLESPAAR